MNALARCGAIGRASLQWLQLLRRPRWLLLFLVALAGSVFAGIHVWAWYHFHAGQAETLFILEGVFIDE